MKTEMISLLMIILSISCSNPSSSSNKAQVKTVGDPMYSQGAPQIVTFKSIKVDIQPPPIMRSYPKAAKEKGIHGDVLLEIWIDEKGIPIKAGSLWGPKELHQAAIDYVLRWKFVPYQTDGKPISVRFRIVMPFRLREGGVYQKLPPDLTY